MRPGAAADGTPVRGGGGFHAGADAEAFDRFLRRLFASTGRSWRGYRKVRRRLRAPLAERIAELGLRTFEGYLARVERDPGERRRLDRLLAISVSRFFRDREDWWFLRDTVLRDLHQRVRGRAVRALSLGCASGEEPYTLRIVWEEMVQAERLAAGEGNPHLALAGADVRRDLLARARRAAYPPSSVHSVPAELRRRYFSERDRTFHLRRDIVAAVDLVLFDFYGDAIPGPVDLVLCRNSAFTYLEEPRRERVARRIAEALVPRGCLMLGSNESREAPPGFARLGRCLFRRR